MRMANHFNGKIIRLLVYIFIISIIYLIPISYIESRSFCLWYNLFELKCFGCGMTRAFFNLSRLNIKEAINYNYMIILVIIPIYLILKDILNILKGEFKNLNKKWKYVVNNYMLFLCDLLKHILNLGELNLHC